MAEIPQPPSFYELLGVSPDCTTHEIERAYRKKAFQLHPDKVGETRRAEFLRISHAKYVLSDDRLRRHYDRHGEDRMPGTPEEARWMEYEQVFRDVVPHFLYFAAAPPRLVLAVALGCVCFMKAWVWLQLGVLFAPTDLFVPETEHIPIGDYYAFFTQDRKNEKRVRITPFSFDYDEWRGYVSEGRDPKTGIVYYTPSFAKQTDLPEHEVRYIRNRFDRRKYPL